MFHPKIQLLSQAGIFNPRMAQRNFFRNNINYELFDTESPLFFSENTKTFLRSLDDVTYLKLYLNFERYLSHDEWQMFKTTVIADLQLHYRLISIVDLKSEILPVNFLVPMMRDMVLINHIPIAYIYTVLNSNEEIRAEIGNYPALMDFITSRGNRGRPQIYIWGDLIPFPYLPEEDDSEMDSAARSMNQLNI